MITDNISISKFQLFFVLIQCQIGIGLLSLPNVVQKSSNGDGWISIILAGLGIQLMLVIYYLLIKRFPDDIYTQITKKILGGFTGRIVNFIIYCYFIITGSISMILTMRVINLHLLPVTPGWIIALLILLASIYLAISDLRIIARFFVLASSLIILLVIMTLLTLAIPKEIQFILPIGDSGIKNIIMGSNGALLSMLGFEAILFLFPFIIQKDKGVLKTISMANLFVTGFYTVVTFICLIIFSPEQIKQIREPVLYLFRGLSYQMLDRLDFIFLAIWILPMTTSIIIYIFLAAKSISNEKKSYKKVVLISGILIFLISLVPQTDEMTNTLTKYVSYFSYGIVFVIPATLLLLSFIFKKHGKEKVV